MTYRPDVEFVLPEPQEEQTLLHLLDRLLDKGVLISGDLRISVAGIDLLFVGLKLLLASVDTADRYRLASNKNSAHADGALVP
ncbi:MAG: gas vesicle protein GvpJ [Beijerinckiaceae bacterium]